MTSFQKLKKGSAFTVAEGNGYAADGQIWFKANNETALNISPNFTPQKHWLIRFRFEYYDDVILNQMNDYIFIPRKTEIHLLRIANRANLVTRNRVIDTFLMNAFARSVI